MFARLVFLTFFVLISSADLRGEEARLETFEVIEFPADAGRAPDRLELQAFGEDFQLELRPNARLLAALSSAQRARILENDLFLAGTLSGNPDSWVRLSRIDGRFSGGFFDGRELYLIDRAGDFASTRSSGIHPDRTIVFRFSDLALEFPIDEGGVLAGRRVGADMQRMRGSEAHGDSTTYLEFVDHLREITERSGEPMLVLPVTVVSDVQFSGVHGASTESVVAGRLNFVDGIYASQLGTGLQLMHQEILTDNGTLTSTNPSNLLVQFRTYMNSGAGSSLPFDGVAHLFTGRNLDGSTVGIAYLGVLCSSFGVGVDQNLNNGTTSSLVIAHELGHNFDAPHDGEGACVNEPFNGIMNPSINGSQQFSDCSIAEMSIEVASASCLIEDPDAQFLFGDGFEAG